MSKHPVPTPWTAASIHFLTQDEMHRLLAVIPSKRNYAIFLVAYRHGLRASEIGLLRTYDLDLKQYRIHITRLKHSLHAEEHHHEHHSAVKDGVHRAPLLPPPRGGMLG